MKTMKTLLEILLERVESSISDFSDFSGLCNEIHYLSNNYHITFADARMLSAFIRSNRPVQNMFLVFINLEKVNKPLCAFYWEAGNKEVRIKWLKKQIKKL